MTAEAARELIYGVHPVAEVLRSRPQQVERIFALREKRPGLGRVLRMGRLAGIPVTYLSRELLGRKVGTQAVHQGIAAQVAPFAYADVERICERAAREPAALLVLMDRVVDPRNLGAALRTCAAAGAHGVLLGSEGSAGLTPAATKAAAGAVEQIPVGREPKPARRLEWLNERGFQTLALDSRGEVGWDALDLRGPIAVLAGGEERGARRGALEACRHRVAIPLAGEVESLNVAVSLGVLLFEAVRQRRGGGS